MVENPFEDSDTSWLNAQNFSKRLEGTEKRYIVGEANLASLVANERRGTLWRHPPPPHSQWDEIPSRQNRPAASMPDLSFTSHAAY